jgi:hypothetical protein
MYVCVSLNLNMSALYDLHSPLRDELNQHDRQSQSLVNIYPTPHFYRF